MKLTDAIILSAEPRSKPYRLFDGLGLYIEVAPSGTKAWRLKYRFQGKEKRLSLGVYPEVSIETARQNLAKEKQLLEQGYDPSEVRKQEKLNFESMSMGSADINHELSSSERDEIDTKTPTETLSESNIKDTEEDSWQNESDDIGLPKEEKPPILDQASEPEPLLTEINTVNEPTFERVIREWHLSIADRDDAAKIIRLFEDHLLSSLGAKILKSLTSADFQEHLAEYDLSRRKDREEIEQIYRFLPEVFIWASSMQYSAKIINFKYILNRQKQELKSLQKEKKRHGYPFHLGLQPVIRVVSSIRWMSIFEYAKKYYRWIANPICHLGKKITSLKAQMKRPRLSFNWGHFDLIRIFLKRLGLALQNILFLFLSIISNAYKFIKQKLGATKNFPWKNLPKVSKKFFWGAYTCLQGLKMRHFSQTFIAYAHTFIKFCRSHTVILLLSFGLLVVLFLWTFFSSPPITSKSSPPELPIQSKPMQAENRDFLLKHSSEVLLTKFFALKELTIDLSQDEEAQQIVKEINEAQLPIRIVGFADARGSRLFNLNLAQNRAMSALKSLMDIGLNPNLVSAIEGISPSESSSCEGEACQEFMKFQIHQLNE